MTKKNGFHIQDDLKGAGISVYSISKDILIEEVKSQEDKIEELLLELDKMGLSHEKDKTKAFAENNIKYGQNNITMELLDKHECFEGGVEKFILVWNGTATEHENIIIPLRVLDKNKEVIKSSVFSTNESVKPAEIKIIKVKSEIDGKLKSEEITIGY